MPDILNLLKKTKDKKKFKKSNYRPWNFMDQIEAEEKTPSLELINTNNGEEKRRATENKNLLPIVSNDFQASEEGSLKNVDVKEKKIKKTFSLNGNESNVDKVFRLYGYQKTLFFFIVDRCFSRGMLNTGAICNSSLAELLETSFRMVKTTIHRLVGKNLITREKGKRGRGGFYVFSIDESIRAASLEYKRLLVTEESMDIKKPSNSHHIDINNTQLSETSLLPELHEEAWQNIDIGPLKKIGFSKVHLKQLSLIPTLSSKTVQNSVCAFAFDLDNNNKAKRIDGDPVNYFMGILRSTGVYNPPKNYEAPQERQMRLWMEEMKQRDTEPRRVKIEEEAFNLSFNKWFEKFTDEQKMEFLPKNLRVNSPAIDNHAAKEKAINYFRKEIWPNIKSKIESGNDA
jgi:hypothetical protein